MTAPSPVVTLKACPFCGSAVYISPNAVNRLAVCPTEGCIGARQTIVLDDPRQVAAWNRRPDEPHAPVETVTVRRGSVNDPIRDKCFRDIQMVVAGQPTGSVLAAQVDSLGVTIAFAVEDRDHARRIAKDLAVDIDSAVELNWQDIRDQLVKLRGEPGHG